MQSKSITSFDFENNIWQVHAHRQLPILLVERRNTALRTVQFAAVSMASNEILWNELDLGDDWWRGLESMSSHFLVLHGFEDANNPIRLGVYVFDLFTGAKVYANDVTTFYSLHHDKLVEKLGSAEDEAFYQIDLANGSKTEITIGEITESAEELHLATPIFIEPADDLFNKILRLILRYHHTEDVVCIEYLEHRQHICIVWTERRAEAMHQHLTLVNSVGELLLHETLASPLKGIALGSFFISQSHLVFVKNSSQLCYFSF